MYFVLIANDGSKFYLLPYNTYLVGRKECDIVILKSDSISRKHALLACTNEEVAITDTNSRYGTFVNEKKLASNSSTSLNDGDTIRFGYKSIYKFQVVVIINTTSGIKSEHKIKLKNHMSIVGGLLIQNWTDRCNYVTVEELMLTVKVLSAIVAGVPIVTLKYWDDYIECLKSHKALPDPLKYVPKCCEVILNENISLEYKEERKGIFNNKVFIFAHKSDKEKMASLIELAGGKALSWDVERINIDKIKNQSSEYMFMQTNDLTETAKKDKALSNFLSNYIKMGNRTIPLQEIALAVINCACDKDCNPKFNRKACVFKTSTQKEDCSEQFLAMPTQSQGLETTIDIKDEIIIPESYDMDGDLTTKVEIDKCFINDIEKFDIDEMSIQGHESDVSLKRESDSNHNESCSKKIKIQENPTRADQISAYSTPLVDTKPNVNPNLPSAKSLFAFKPTNIASERSNSSMYQNPFSKKRKAELDEQQPNVFKKPSVENDSLPSTSSTSNSKLAINPFSNMFKSKTLTQKQNIDNSKVTSTPKNKPNENRNTKNLNSCDIDFSAITAVGAELEKSFQWITKSSNKSYSGDSTNQNKDEKVDSDLLVFINSFRDAVVVQEEEDMVVRKPEVTLSKSNSYNSDLKNYKKFKKVQPLKIQTNIIPESRYVSIICNDISEREYIPAELENHTEDVDSEVIRERRRERQYIF